MAQHDAAIGELTAQLVSVTQDREQAEHAATAAKDRAGQKRRTAGQPARHQLQLEQASKSGSEPWPTRRPTGWMPRPGSTVSAKYPVGRVATGRVLFG